MAMYNTGNPVGSTQPKDLSDNAQVLDKLVVGTDPSVVDRLGNLRYSWAGMEYDFQNAQAGREAAFQQFLAASAFVFIGDYTAGLNFTNRSQYMIRDGVPYRLSPSTTLPYTTTGNWATEISNFTPVSSDDILRQDLADPTNNLVAWERSTLSRSIDSVSGALSGLKVNLWEFADLATGYASGGGPETWDWTPAIRAAVATRRVVYVPQGRYKITGKFLLSDPAENAAIRACAGIVGDGSSKTVFVISGMDETVMETGHTVTTSQNFSRVEGIVLEGFSFIGDGTNTENNHGFLPRSMFKCKLRDVVFRSLGGHGIYAPRDTSLEVVSGYAGGSDVYGCQLSFENVFCHSNGRSGLWSDIFSFVLFCQGFFCQDNGEWGAVIGSPLLVWHGGSAQYNGRKSGLTIGQGGGILCGAGVESTPACWSVSQVEIDRNRPSQVRIERGNLIKFSECRLLDSTDNAGQFWSSEQIYMNGAYCKFENFYVRLPSSTAVPTKLWVFGSSAVGNIVEDYYQQVGITTGLTEVTDTSVATPGNLVRSIPGRYVGLNRPYPEKNLAIATIAAGTALSGTPAVLALTADSRVFLRSETIVSNTFAPGFSGVFRVSGTLALGSFASAGATTINLQIRVNDAANTVLESDVRTVTAGGAANLKFSGIVALNPGDTVTLRATSSIGASTVAATGQGQVTFERL